MPYYYVAYMQQRENAENKTAHLFARET